jgi:hypothetical protein
MPLHFVRDTVYLAERDAVRTTAIDGNTIVPCVTTRSALALLGCRDEDAPERMVQKFEHHRPMIERAVAFKHGNGDHHSGSGALLIDGRDLCALFGFAGL